MTHCPRCGKDNPAEIHTCTPLALKLADWLERRTMKMLQDRQAAAELRRLHAENEALRDKNNQLHTEINTAWQEVKTEQRLSFRTQVAKLEAKVESDEALLRQARDTMAYWLEHGETPGSHDMIQRTHDILQERLKWKGLI